MDQNYVQGLEAQESMRELTALDKHSKIIRRQNNSETSALTTSVAAANPSIYASTLHNKTDTPNGSIEDESSSMNVEEIQAVLCGSITRYVILYGTSHQSVLANTMMKSTERIAQEMDATPEGCTSTVTPNFALHLAEIHDLAGDYLWMHALNHFKQNVRPTIGVELDDAALEKALDVLQTKPPSVEICDCSLDTIMRKDRVLYKTMLFDKSHNIFSEKDVGFK